MFSVVIALYNKAHMIERTLQSVLNQIFTNYEVIIIDDGSTDNGVEVIHQLTNDPRIRIISQRNQGVSVARNRGVKESKFDYIAFLDGDDEWLPNFLYKIKEAIEKFPTAGMYGTSSLHKDFISGETFDSTIKKYKNKITKGDCFKKTSLLPHTSAIVIKKAVLFTIDTEYNVFPIGMKVCEDWACFHRIALIQDLIYIGIPLGIRNNNIKGQITGLSEEQRSKLYPDVIEYYNLVYRFWMERKKSNPYFIHFLRYTLRTRFKHLVLSKNMAIIDLMILNLDKGLLNSIEVQLYHLKKISILSVLYINVGKIYSKICKYVY
jgi:glycosyltransferase involved in cell wall biosynthesis